TRAREAFFSDSHGRHAPQRVNRWSAKILCRSLRAQHCKGALAAPRARRETSPATSLARAASSASERARATARAVAAQARAPARRETERPRHRATHGLCQVL